MTKALEKFSLREEMTRRKTRRMSMLTMFKKYGVLTTKDLNHFGTGCSSRLKELRKEGHKIVAHQIAPGQWQYVYLGKIEDNDVYDG